MDSDASSTPDADSESESAGRLLLTRDAVPSLVTLFDLPSDSAFATDVYRALEQARLRIERAASGSKSS